MRARACALQDMRPGDRATFAAAPPGLAVQINNVSFNCCERNVSTRSVHGQDSVWRSEPTLLLEGSGECRRLTTKQRGEFNLETNQEKPTPDPICISFFKHIKSNNFLDKFPVTFCISTAKTKSILIVSVNMYSSNKDRFEYTVKETKSSRLYY